jgi:hypothetical protein
MFLWLAITIFVGIALFQCRKKDNYFGLFIIINIALFQDLAFDGFFNIMALEFYVIGHAIYMRYGLRTEKGIIE